MLEYIVTYFHNDHYDDGPGDYYACVLATASFEAKDEEEAHEIASSKCGYFQLEDPQDEKPINFDDIWYKVRTLEEFQDELLETWRDLEDYTPDLFEEE